MICFRLLPITTTGVSVEAVDPVFQTKMLDMLKQTGRGEIVVGWYHSHPGFGCWLSGVDVNTQSSFESLNARSVAVVIDPIQSVRGKVVIDAFRLIGQHLAMFGKEPRQTTSNIGHLEKPSITALLHGLNRHYYSMPISYRKNELEQKMLLKVHMKAWTEDLKVTKFDEHKQSNIETMKRMVKLAEQYTKSIQEEATTEKKELLLKSAGKLDAKRHLQVDAEDDLNKNIDHSLGVMLDSVAF